MDFNEILNTPDTTDQYDAQDIQTNKIYAVLACFGILFWIPLVAAKDSKFARFYSNQGCILLIVEIALSIISGFFGILGQFVGILGLLGSLVTGLLGLVSFALLVFVLIQAGNGKAKEMPLLGGIRIIK